MSGLLIPFIPDYIQHDSMGLASAYQNIFQNIGNILVSSVIPEIAAFIDIGYVYYGISILFFFTIIFMFFSIKDVTQAEN